MKLRKSKRQRAVLTITDTDEGGFTAHVCYEPSVLKLDHNSPSVNAMVRLGIILKSKSAELAQPLMPDKKVVSTD
jgi:hypothetical protein